jgi:hypothetical protein
MFGVEDLLLATRRESLSFFTIKLELSGTPPPPPPKTQNVQNPHLPFLLLCQMKISSIGTGTQSGRKRVTLFLSLYIYIYQNVIIKAPPIPLISFLFYLHHCQGVHTVQIPGKIFKF